MSNEAKKVEEAFASMGLAPKVNGQVEPVAQSAASLPTAAPVHTIHRQAQPKAAAPVVEPAVPVAATPVPGNISMELLLGLFQTMMQREARLDKREQEIQERINQRDKQRKLNAREFDRNKLLLQAQCKHEKGRGKGSIFNGIVDYAVYRHTFTDHSQTIKCRICKMTWKPGDTKEFLIQNGVKIPNHTKIGWDEAAFMTKQSTDKESSSEAPLQVEGEIAALLEGRDPSILSSLLNSPEGKAFLERTKPVEQTPSV